MLTTGSDGMKILYKFLHKFYFFIKVSLKYNFYNSLQFISIPLKEYILGNHSQSALHLKFELKLHIEIIFINIWIWPLRAKNIANGLAIQNKFSTFCKYYYFLIRLFKRKLIFTLNSNCVILWSFNLIISVSIYWILSDKFIRIL